MATLVRSSVQTLRLPFGLARTFASSVPTRSTTTTTHLNTLADLSPNQIHQLILSAAHHKHRANHLRLGSEDKPLAGKSVALLFSKRSTRTRLATETAVAYLGKWTPWPFSNGHDNPFSLSLPYIEFNLLISPVIRRSCHFPGVQ